MCKFTEIISERFVLRHLSETDANENYLKWFNDKDVKNFIVSASNTHDINHLKEYIRQRQNRNDILFLGIFEKESYFHIGNIKYEPISFENNYAVMGILIGEKAFRNKGVAKEVLLISSEWLKKHYNIKKILLGVEKNNLSAIKSYKDLGFKIKDTPFMKKLHSEILTMVWDL